MSLIAFIVIGLVAGLLARAIVPGTQSMGMLATTGLGIAGSFVGGLIYSVIYSRADWMALRPTGLLFSIAGAVVVLMLFGMGRRFRA